MLDRAGARARQRYFLYVSRMEPENRALEVRQAFEKAPTDMKLALIGDAPYADEYIRRVRDTQDRQNCRAGGDLRYWLSGTGILVLRLHPGDRGRGHHPALIEAMGRGAIVLYLETPKIRKCAATRASRGAPKRI